MSKQKCKGTTKAGNPCQAWAMDGSDYCPAHQPKTKRSKPRTSTLRGIKVRGSKGPKQAMVQPPAAVGRESRAVESRKESSKKTSFSHPTKKRCTRPDKRYPAFLARKCDRLMVPDGTKEKGQIKWWKCPACHHREKTVGKAV